MAYHTPPLKKSEETRGKAITQARSHPIPKFYIFFFAIRQYRRIIIFYMYRACMYLLIHSLRCCSHMWSCQLSL